MPWSKRVRGGNALNPRAEIPGLRGVAALLGGTVSYSLYLFHDVGVATAARMLGLPLFGYGDDAIFGWVSLGLFCVRLALTIALALVLVFAMFSLVERPGQRWLRSMPVVQARPRLSPPAINP